MNKFSQHSLTQLETVHTELRLLCTYVLDAHDFKVLEGHRGKAEQDKAFAEGRSKVKWPDGKHNALPSLAVDLLPYVGGKFIGWPDQIKDPKLSKYCSMQWAYFGGVVLGTAETLYRLGEMSHRVRWGHDWNENDNLSDQNFVDAPHFELVLT